MKTLTNIHSFVFILRWHKHVKIHPAKVSSAVWCFYVMKPFTTQHCSGQFYHTPYTTFATDINTLCQIKICCFTQFMHPFNFQIHIDLASETMARWKENVWCMSLLSSRNQKDQGHSLGIWFNLLLMMHRHLFTEQFSVMDNVVIAGRCLY